MMWLAAVVSGHDRPTTAFLRVMERVTGGELPEIFRVACYRHRYFGTPFHQLVQAVMRGRSFWTVGEREIIAAFTSRTNECPFCISAHTAIAAAYATPSVVDMALRDPAAAPLRPELNTMLAFLEKLSRDPDSLTDVDAKAVRDSAIPADAVDQAIHISTLFHVINRVMNAVGGQAMDDRTEKLAVRLVKLGGYRIPPPIRLLSRGRVATPCSTSGRGTGARPD